MKCVFDKGGGVTPLSPPVPGRIGLLERSSALERRAQTRIAGLTSSMMKRPEHFCPGQFPGFLDRGEGAVVIDADGNQYIDFIAGLGANSLGHRHARVEAAILAALRRGVLHSLPHELEVEAAEALVGIVPGAEMARFFKTGADATSAAVRLARHISGKEKIVTIGYNGWHDHFMFDTPGVPQGVAALTTRMPLFSSDDEPRLLEHVKRHRSELAAVLLSVPYNRKLSADFIRELRCVCDGSDVLLIFDEIVTGLRLSLGGASEFFGVRPDFSTYSKAIAAGMPLSAIVGPREHLSRMAELQVSTTFGGELLSLAAACACIFEHREADVPGRIARLGRRLADGINDVAQRAGSSLRVHGYDSIPFFCFDRDMQRHVELMRVLQGKMASRGVLLRRDVNFIHGAMTEMHIDTAIEAAQGALSEMEA